MWDTLHLGRAWADRCQVRPETEKDLAKQVRDSLEAQGMPDDDAIKLATRKP